MKRLIYLPAACLCFLAGCAQGEPAKPSASATPATAPAPPAPAPDARIGTLQLTCGGESFRVAFEASRAVVVGADGGNTELPKLDAQPGAPPNVATFTNGVLTFAKETAEGKPDLIRFARGRMAFQDCATAQN